MPGTPSTPHCRDSRAAALTNDPKGAKNLCSANTKHFTGFVGSQGVVIGNRTNWYGFRSSAFQPGKFGSTHRQLAFVGQVAASLVGCDCIRHPAGLLPKYARAI